MCRHEQKYVMALAHIQCYNEEKKRAIATSWESRVGGDEGLT